MIFLLHEDEFLETLEEYIFNPITGTQILVTIDTAFELSAGFIDSFVPSLRYIAYVSFGVVEASFASAELFPLK